MAISARTRKRLWAKSGNRCAIDKVELIRPARDRDDDTVYGRECHIRGPRPESPRYDPTLSAKDADVYENLILLCGDCHTDIDDNKHYYTPQRLQLIKVEHEAWVRETLGFRVSHHSTDDKQEDVPAFLFRLRTGEQIFSVIAGSYGYDFAHGDLREGAEAEIVGGFLQQAMDWGELSDELQSAETVRATYSLDQALSEIEEAGFWVFGGVAHRRVQVAGDSSLWRVAVLRILSSDDPEIIPLKSEEEPESDSS